MDYRHCLGSLGNSSTASESSDPAGTVGPGYSKAFGTFFIFLPTMLLYSFASFCVSFSSVSLSYFIPAVSIRKCGKTLVPELHVSSILSGTGALRSARTAMRSVLLN